MKFKNKQVDILNNYLAQKNEEFFIAESHLLEKCEKVKELQDKLNKYEGSILQNVENTQEKNKEYEQKRSFEVEKKNIGPVIEKNKDNNIKPFGMLKPSRTKSKKNDDGDFFSEIVKETKKY